VESEVYEKLYGKRSGTVSAPLPVNPPPEADADSPPTHTPSADRARGLAGDPDRGTRIDEGHTHVWVTPLAGARGPK
jgi:hypothetical protein